MVRRLERGEALGTVARQLRLSPRSVRRWWTRYQQEGLTGLVDRSSRPHHSPRRLARWRRRQITRLRRQRWSSLRIAEHLGLPLPTVVHVQRQLGLARLAPLTPQPPVRRYERRVPGALVHLDIKKLGRIGRVGHRIHGNHQIRSRGIGTATTRSAAAGSAGSISTSRSTTRPGWPTPRSSRMRPAPARRPSWSRPRPGLPPTECAGAPS